MRERLGIMDAFRRICLAAAVALLGSLAWAAAAGASAIGRANLDGSGVRPGFVTVGGSSFLGGVVVDGGHIYWANPAAHTIGRANLDGTHAEQSFITVPLATEVPVVPSSVAVDAGHIYWNSLEGSLGLYGHASSYIGRANLDGAGVEPHFISDAGGQIAGRQIAVDRTHLYWTEGQAIGRANLDGTDIHHNFITGLGSLGSLAVDPAHIYWAASCSNQSCTRGAIGRANLDGTGVQRNFITGLRAPGSMAMGGGHIYWTSSNHNVQFPPPDTIGRANLDGSHVEQSFITVPHADLAGLAVDTGHIYWSGSPRPWITALYVTPRTFTLAGRWVNGRCVPVTRANGNRLPCSRPIELKISYKLITGPFFTGGVMFSIQRRAAGRLVGGRCVAPTPANRRYPGCTRLIAYPREQPLLSDMGKAGWNSFTFNGIIVTYDAHGHSQYHKLTPGSYLLTANISLGNTTTTSFRIAP
jgi:hypothetical protein